MASMNQHRRRRMGLEPDTDTVLAAPEPPGTPEEAETDSREEGFSLFRKKKKHLPYWLDAKMIFWMILVAASLTALAFLK